MRSDAHNHQLGLIIFIILIVRLKQSEALSDERLVFIYTLQLMLSNTIYLTIFKLYTERIYVITTNAEIDYFIDNSKYLAKNLLILFYSLIFAPI